MFCEKNMKTNNFPKAKRFLEETGFTTDEAIKFFEELERSGVENGSQG